MSDFNPYQAEQMVHERMEEARRRANEHSLIRLARESQRAGDPRSSPRFLYWLGCSLTALWHRLEQHGLAPAPWLPKYLSGCAEVARAGE